MSVQGAVVPSVRQDRLTIFKFRSRDSTVLTKLLGTRSP